MTFTPIYHTQRAAKGYDLSVMRTPEGNLSLAIAYFHNGGSAITLTPDEEAALLAALTSSSPNSRSALGEVAARSADGGAFTDARTGRPSGDHGTANDAMEWAFDVVAMPDDDAASFLQMWRFGIAAEDYPEFYDWLKRTEQIAVSANWSGQPNPGASIPPAFFAETANKSFPEPPLPDSQLANDGACT